MRVLALTADTTLQVALVSMLPDWELRTVRDPERAPEEARDADLALIDRGSTELGMEIARAMRMDGCTIPCVVIGEESLDDSLEPLAHVLLRPFTLPDLRDMMMTAAEEARAAADARAELSEIVHEEPPPPPPTPEAQPVAVEEPIAEPVAVADEVEGPRQEEDVPAARMIVLEPEPEAIDVPCDASAITDEPPQSPVIEATPLVDSVPERVPEPVPEPEREPANSLFADLGWAEPDQPITVAPVEPARSVQVVVRPQIKPQPREIVSPRAQAKKRLRRRSTPAVRQPAPGSILQRLLIAQSAGRELEGLLTEIPVLAEGRAVAHTFLREIVELLGPQIAAVYTPTNDGTWTVLAPHGLSQVETEIRVSPEQPLFKEVITSRTGVYIAPVDLAQGLVAGIGGARTETLMAAPLEATGICVGVVIVGGFAFTEGDLDRLCDLASEAAPGLAFAQMVERLRARLWKS